MKRRHEYSKRLIGENLKKARERRGLTVEDVREYLQLGSVQAIYKYESGQSYPPADTLLALMELYDVERKDLIYKQLIQSEELSSYAHWSLFADQWASMCIQLDIGWKNELLQEHMWTVSHYAARLCR